MTAVLIDAGFAVWLARLSPTLVLLDLQQLHDPDIVHDPFPDGGGVSPPTEVTANALPRDSVRTAPDGEEAVVVVMTPLDSVLLYRLAFSTHWESPRRTLVLPVTPHLPFLPIGGTFDTFGAMWSSFRALVDVDDNGNAYVAFWANPRVIQSHSAFAGDDLHKVSTNPFSQDSDVLLEKLDRAGRMLWARLVGTENEDEPYAVRAAHGEVAVVGRARRVPGDDNTFWDAFLSVSAADGTLRGTDGVPARGLEHLSRRRRNPRRWLAGRGKRGLVTKPEGSEHPLLRHQAPHRALRRPMPARCESRSPPARATTRFGPSSPIRVTGGSGATRTGR